MHNSLKTTETAAKIHLYNDRFPSMVCKCQPYSHMHFENIAMVVNEQDYKKLKENDLKVHS